MYFHPVLLLAGLATVLHYLAPGDDDGDGDGDGDDGGDDDGDVDGDVVKYCTNLHLVHFFRIAGSNCFQL